MECAMNKQFYGKGIPHLDATRLKGKLIVIEGSDGSGRSTQISMLRNWMEEQGYATVEIGIKRSQLVAAELDIARQSTTLSPMTMTLYYASDFADQLEHVIIPSLRANFIVLADRYIYTLIARAIARRLNKNWISQLYGIALIPDAVFYLSVEPEVLAERTFRKNDTLSYWESGMDIHRQVDMYRSFISYQRKLQRIFTDLQLDYGFDVVDGNHSPQVVFQELVSRIRPIIEQPVPIELSDPEFVSRLVK
jgi:dTMP kinase